MFSSSYSSCSQSPSDAKPISPRSLPKKKFTEEDDCKLRQIIATIGTQSWTDVAKAMGDRNPRQCKERWVNYLDPAINRGPFTPEEDELLVQKQIEIGSKWVTIAHFFNHRTDAQLKNRWQMLVRKMKKLNTQTRKVASIVHNTPSTGTTCATANVSHITEIQQESAQPFETGVFPEIEDWELDFSEADAFFTEATIM